MNDKRLIEQLRTLRNIHPDQNWAVLTRSKLSELAEIRHKSAGISALFNFVVPRPLAISALAAVVVMVFGVSIIQEGLIDSESSNNFASITKYRALADETVQELRQIADDVRGRTPSGGTTPTSADELESSDYTVIFGEDADEQEKFKKALRENIESKIGKINDLFAQLDDGDLTREISLNTRKFEENFEKLVDEEIAAQVKILLEDAQEALDEGNLIDALELVVAIEKLLK